MFQDERSGPDQPVECQHCGASVLVKKNSLAHTVVQWTSATDACAPLTVDGPARALTPTCPYLRDSIDAAVRSRALGVGHLEPPAA